MALEVQVRFLPSQLMHQGGLIAINHDVHGEHKDMLNDDGASGDDINAFAHILLFVAQSLLVKLLFSLFQSLF